MKKRIMVLGGKLFTNCAYNNGEYTIEKNNIISKLKEKFIIDDFSNNALTSINALNYINTFINERNYNSCILQLGEMDNDSNVFKDNLQAIIDSLKAINVKPILVGLSENNCENKKNQYIIDELAEKNKVALINGRNSINQYIANTDTQIRRTIIKLSN